MRAKRVAAAVALGLTGAVPAGVAWADHESDHRPPGCDHARQGKNPNCGPTDGQTPPNGGGNGNANGTGGGFTAPKHYLVDSTAHDVCHSGHCLSHHVRAKAVETTGPQSTTPTDPNHLVHVTAGPSTVITATGSLNSRTLDAYAADGGLTANVSPRGAKVRTVSAVEATVTATAPEEKVTITAGAVTVEVSPRR